MRTILLTATAMLAFAANSVLCRMALDAGVIDPASFTSIRLIAGALFLAILLKVQRKNLQVRKSDPRAAFTLFTYAICFSYAYTALDTGTGALILFASVQLTMIAAGVLQGKPPTPLAWIGVVIAASGLIYLLLPGATAPGLTDAALMAIAGLSWGIYSLRGAHATDPVTATAANFTLAVPLALITSLTLLPTLYLSSHGIILAVISGALASGLGYVIWYAALPWIRPVTAASVQLSVPVLAAFGGVLLLAEPMSSRLLFSAVLTLGGIALVIASKRNVTTQIEPNR